MLYLTVYFNRSIAMMAARYSVSEAIYLLFDNDFGLSEGDLREEEGDGLYAYLGYRSLSREAVEDLSRELDEGHSQPEAGSDANSDLFADSDDGLEKEDLDEACFGKSKYVLIKTESIKLCGIAN